MTDPVLDAIAAGATIVTPNRRLARHLRQRYERAQQAAGLRAWATPAILPFTDWALSLWSARRDTAPVLSEAQRAWLWRTVVDAGDPPLLDAQGAAELAADAWQRFHAWRLPHETWRAWRPLELAAAADADDTAIFSRWADTFERARARSGCLDPAQAFDALAAMADDASGVRAALAGFSELTTQQRRLVDALVARGARIERIAAQERQPGTEVAWTRAAHARDELHAALSWARAHVLRAPAAQVGIVVPDLQQRRGEVIALADEVLAPATLVLPASPSARAYQVSLGVALADVPLIAAAIDLIVLREGRLAAATAAALLRSPYLGDADLTARSCIERGWLDDGVAEVSLGDAVGALLRSSPALGQRWRAFVDAGHSSSRATPRDWAERWRTWLDAAGWPGTRGLDSAEFQARDAWHRLLAEFVTLGTVVKQLKGSDAVAMLLSLARERLFQPEGAVVPVLIMGTLEASGLAFDALWITGMRADRWPEPARPDPLLPVPWQRLRGVPGSSAALALARARQLVHGFSSAAQEVMFSAPAIVDEQPMAPSALIESYARVEMPLRARRWQDLIADSADIEVRSDDRGPPLPMDASLRGGTSLITAQSACPFQAFARMRLGIEPWPAPLDGWSPLERGLLLHRAMDVFWTIAHDQPTLVRWSAGETEAQVDAAIAFALEAWRRKEPVRARAMPAAVRDAEAVRLRRVMVAWLAIDRDRPPFAVREIEAECELCLSGRTFRVRLDRVDALDDGGAAIIDYKSGRGDAPSSWFRERPCGTQIGMYALALDQRVPAVAVRAAAFASLRADDVKPVGIAFDPAAWPALSSRQALTWDEARQRWRQSLDALARDFADGVATVDPRRNPWPCDICGLQPLCRIDSVMHTGEDTDE